MERRLWEMGASEIAASVRRRDFSVREVVQAHLGRIAERNGELNAIAVVLDESALEAADRADHALSAGRELGPLGGVPVTVKENQDVIGSATTHGLVALANATATRDDPHIQGLRQAGAIFIGRTNMPEFGMRWHTDNDRLGATVNPWSADHTPGGSSGGDAAAVAAGLVPLAVGNDGAGSLRWPAQCCGVAALKPSQGRVPIVGPGDPPQPVPFAFQLLAAHGPIARHVADLRLALGPMCSRSGGDPFHVPAPVELGAPMPEPARVGLIVDPGGRGVHPNIRGALDSVAKRLSSAGYSVEDIEPPHLARAGEVYTQIMNRFGRTTPEPTRAPVGLVSEGFDRFWAALNDSWQRAEGEATHDPMMERAGIARAWATQMEQTPLILAPIATQPAFRVGSDLDEAWCERWLVDVRMVVVVNLLGLPSVAVPVGVADGLPQVVQIIGPRFREDLCLEAAEVVERGLGIEAPSF